MNGFLRRMHRASLLDAEVYEEVEADRGATAQSALVVLLSALGAGIGSIHNGGLTGIVGCTVAAFVTWYVWAFLACQIGTKLLPGPQTQADTGELLRTLGFSTAPGILRVLGLIEPLAGWVFLVCSLWMLVAMVVAVRQALDYEGTGRAVLVCAIGFPVYAVGMAVTLLWLGPWPV